MPRTTSRTGKNITNFDYTFKHDQPIPTGAGVKSTKWIPLYTAMDELKEGSKENVYIEVDKDYEGDIQNVFSNIRSAMYRWGETAGLGKNERIHTVSGFTADKTPFVMGWIGSK